MATVYVCVSFGTVIFTVANLKRLGPNLIPYAAGICLLVCLGALLHWWRSHVEIKGNEMQVVGWRTCKLKLTEIHRVEIDPKYRRLVSFYVGKRKSAAFSLDRMYYGDGDIVRIIRLLQGRVPELGISACQRLSSRNPNLAPGVFSVLLALLIVAINFNLPRPVPGAGVAFLGFTAVGLYALFRPAKRAAPKGIPQAQADLNEESQ